MIILFISTKILSQQERKCNFNLFLCKYKNKAHFYDGRNKIYVNNVINFWMSNQILKGLFQRNINIFKKLYLLEI